MHAYGDFSAHIKRMGPLPNEVPVFVAVNDILARTEKVVVSLGALKVYSGGVEILLEVRQQDGEVRTFDFANRFGRAGREQYLVGVEFADGRKAVAEPMTIPRGNIDADTPLLSGGHGGGSDHLWTATYFLSPIPPEGQLSIVFAWPAREISETFVQVDASAIRGAAASITELWPHDPAAQPAPMPRPEPPDVMPGGWFDQVLAPRQV